MTRDEVVLEARKWLGVPWRHQGRSITGVDCIGLIIMVGTALNVPHEDKTGYAHQPQDRTFLNHLRKFLTPVSYTDTRPGTVGVFKQSHFPCHVGIFSEKNGICHLINSRVDRGTVVEEHYIPDFDTFRLVERLAFPGLE